MGFRKNWFFRKLPLARATLKSLRFLVDMETGKIHTTEELMLKTKVPTSIKKVKDSYTVTIWKHIL